MSERALTNKDDARRARAALERVLVHFKYKLAPMGRALGVSRQIVRRWVARGYVSQPGAQLIHDHAPQWKLKVTREELRPDVYFE